MAGSDTEHIFMEERPTKATMHPSFLKSNSTIHVWIFGAIAEVIDNAYDASRLRNTYTVPSITSPSPWRSPVLSSPRRNPVTSPRRSPVTSPMRSPVTSPSPRHGNTSQDAISSPCQHPDTLLSTVVKSPMSPKDFILQIDMSKQGSKDCLVFTDNGCGMNYEDLCNMLSFGNTKNDIIGNIPRIGRYGIGFKSGSMRIGKDVLVLTISHDAWCVGLLSQTYHEATQATEIYTPIVTLDKKTKKVVKGAIDLRVIEKYSILNSLEKIVQKFNSIKKTLGIYNHTGTRVIIYNLAEGQLNFKKDEKGMDDIIDCQTKTKANELKYLWSLREYCSILYMPNSSQSFTANNHDIKILLSGSEITQKVFEDVLEDSQVVTYQHTDHDRVEITFGFTKQETLGYGMMLYHRNRFIKYEKVGCQKKNNDEGNRVVGIVDVDQLLEPNHIKQDFNRTDSYTTVMKALGTKLNDYCKARELKRKKDTKTIIPPKRSSNLSQGCVEESVREKNLNVQPKEPHAGSRHSVQEPSEKDNVLSSETQPLQQPSLRSRVRVNARDPDVEPDSDEPEHDDPGSSLVESEDDDITDDIIESDQPGPSTRSKARHQDKSKKITSHQTVTDKTRDDNSSDDDQVASTQRDKNTKGAVSKSCTAVELTKLRESVKSLLELAHPKSLEKWKRHISFEHLSDIDKIVIKLVKDLKEKKKAKSQK